MTAVAPFIYEAAPSRVVFGPGSLDKAPEEIDRLGAERVLILTTPGRKKLGEELAARLGTKAAGVFSAAVMHVPAETAEAGRAEASRLQADCYIAIGGGSATGLAKAIAVVTGNPILAIPTTYSGSEMTPT
ncbi:MAG TPA: iron-containing alcohol dehydrogenase, partial [Candidatus Acidoferrales bacterium]